GRITCPPGKICRNERCVDPPTCAERGERCDQKACCGGHCHQRLYSDHPTCVYNAFSGEDCSSGIPCEGTSQCIHGRCSLQRKANCDFDGAVCPHGSSCQYARSSEAGTHKIYM
ncbi:uncharacterized protein BX664DRAFT_250843, partial [Halteromyces radiatus]|uniref:uncharacterized protein n=1 Tax=Halteromyces radiatus TaxID=101107 RepID=UPI00221FBF90